MAAPSPADLPVKPPEKPRHPSHSVHPVNAYARGRRLKVAEEEARIA